MQSPQQSQWDVSSLVKYDIFETLLTFISMQSTLLNLQQLLNTTVDAIGNAHSQIQDITNKPIE
jgi:hypothetical protein